MPNDFPTPLEELTVTRDGSPGQLGFGSDTGRLDLQGWRRHGSALTPLGDGRALGFDPTARSTVRVDSGSDHNAFPSLVLHGTSALSCFYRSGSDHISADGEIVRQDSTDLGATWSAPATVLSDGTADLRDPSVRIVGSTWVMSYFTYDVSTTPGRPIEAKVVRSTDGGATWGTPVTLAPFATWTAVSDGVLDLGSGVLLLAVYGKDTPLGRTSARIMRSTDGGASWSLYATAADGEADGRHYEEPALVRLASGTIRCVMRTKENRFYYTDSADNGATWGARTAMFAADGSPFLKVLASGRVLLLYRVVAQPSPVALRTADATMSVWTGEQVLEAVNGSLSTYAEAVELEPGVLAIAYGYQHNDDSRIYLAWAAVASAELPNGVDAPPALATGGLSVLGSAPVHIGEPDDSLFGDDRVITRALMVRAGKAHPTNSRSRLYLVGNTETPGTPLGAVAFGQAEQQGISALVSAVRGTEGSYASVEIWTRGSAGFVRGLRVEQRGRVLIGEGADNPHNLRGLTIDQGGNDDHILTLRSTGDVTQPMTQFAESTAFLTVGKVDATGGGTQVRAFRGTAGTGPVALAVAGHTAGPADATKAAASRAVVELYASRTSGNTVGNLGTGDNAFALRGRVGGQDNALVIVDAGGDQHHPTWGSGIVLTSPDGSKRARISLDNSGALVTTPL